MTSFTRRRAARTLASAIALSVPLCMTLQGNAHAQSDWPNKPVRIVASFAPGGSSDLVARQLAAHLTTRYGQQFIVENRPGAGGNIGVTFVAKAPADGYTLGLATSGPLANNKSLYKPMPFDAEKDLTPIALVGEIPLVIAVNPAIKAGNLRELVALSKTGTNVLSFAHPGNGTIGHLGIEYMRINSGARLLAIPYKGDAPAMTDAISGSTSGVSAPVTSLIPNVQAGKLRALAVTSASRFPGLPNVPTANEQGVKLEATVWSAMIGPAGLPKNIVTSLNDEINKYTSSAEGKAKLASLGMNPLAGKPEQLSKLMATEAVKWKKVVESAKISVE